MSIYALCKDFNKATEMQISTTFFVLLNILQRNKNVIISGIKMVHINLAEKLKN